MTERSPFPGGVAGARLRNVEPDSIDAASLAGADRPSAAAAHATDVAEQLERANATIATMARSLSRAEAERREWAAKLAEAQRPREHGRIVAVGGRTMSEPGVAVAVPRETLVPGALRAARQGARMTCREMAGKIGKSATWVSDVEAGRGQITPKEVSAWAQITGSNSDDLYGVHRDTA